MSTEPDAPPSTDDATRQEQDKDATSDDDAERARAKSARLVIDIGERESNIMIAVLAECWSGPDSPIHPSVTDDDKKWVRALVSVISEALHYGDRYRLDALKVAYNAVLIHGGGAPRPNLEGDPQRFFLRSLANIILLASADPESGYARYVLDNPGTYFDRYDPAFAKLSPAHFQECIRGLTWGKRGPGARGWIRAAARIAVSVGAFDSNKLEGDDDVRAATLDNSLGKLWSTRDKQLFYEPEEFEQWRQAKRVMITPE